MAASRYLSSDIAKYVLLAPIFATSLCALLAERADSDWLTVGLAAYLFIVFFIVLALFVERDLPFHVRVPDILFILIICYSFVNSLIQDSVISYLTYWKWSSACCAYCIGRLMPHNGKLIGNLFIFSGLIQSVIILFQWVGLMSSHSFFFAVSGTYGNPAPAAVVVALSVIFCLTRLFNDDISRREVIILIISIAILVVSLIPANSRACWFGIVVAVFYLFWRRRKQLWVLIAACTFAAVFLVFLYFIRQNSADARLLIWRVGFDMFEEKPFFGGGISYFASNYMYAQAQYFQSHPFSELVMIAGNHTSAYNEILHLLCEQGLVGLTIFVVFYFFSISNNNNFGTAEILFISVVSLFLYTVEILFVFIAFWLILGMIASNGREAFPINGHVNNIGRSVCALLAFASICVLFDPAKLERYASYPNHPSYEYACEKGILAQNKGDFLEAEHFYVLAQNMIPSRITASYLLFKLYLQTDQNKAQSIGRYILTRQPIRNVGNLTLKMKDEVRQKMEILQIHSNI